MLRNHRSHAREENKNGSFAYVTVGGRNEVRVFRTRDFAPVATIAVGKLPHGLWPSADGARMYVGLENDDALLAIDTLSNKVIATIPIGQAPQAVVYVPNAVPQGAGTAGLEPLGLAGQALHLALGPHAETSVTLFDQGLVQVLQASVTGLPAKQPYVLGFSERASGEGALQPLAAFSTNPAGAAIVNVAGPIRQLVHDAREPQRRYLAIAAGTPDKLGAVVQVQAPSTP